MIAMNRKEVQAIADHYNENLEPGELPITTGEICDAQRIIIVECPHPVACDRCRKASCGEIV